MASDGLDLTTPLPAVVGLLLPGGPAAVLRAVRSVVVYPVNTGTGRARAHVCVEVGKVVPPFADVYAPAAVAVVGRVGVGPAAAPHLGPDDVNGVAPETMPSVGPSRYYSSLQTATGPCCPRRQVVRADSLLGAAFAPTKPEPLVLFTFGHSEHRKPTKHPTNQSLHRQESNP